MGCEEMLSKKAKKKMDGRGLREDVASRNTLRCFPRVIPDTNGMVIRVKTENITDTHNTTQPWPTPV